MKQKLRLLLQEQLDITLQTISDLREAKRPSRGWLRAVREALGVSGKQFAKRLGVSPPRVTALEKNEILGSVTLNTMRQAAEALDCKFVYALVPNQESLAATVRQRAENLAKHRLTKVAHSMLLEDQQLSILEQEKAFRAETDRIIMNMPKELWDLNDEI